MGKRINKWLLLSGFIAIAVCIELAGGWFTNTSVHTWYLTLRKASWNPPGWVFGPVWTLLYLLIALAGWRVSLQPASKKRTKGLILYFIQLGLNFLWSFFFFYLQRPLLGLLDIIFLLIFIMWTLVTFWSLSRTAFWLLVPYALWTLYAFTLNGTIWLIN